ncbi:MAG TPA: DUF4446 family protein [Jatrophihabitans sp.]|jgi:hypothetical protein|uniref:DUF4446 family protein n=1 Tax=Jatrophihabitans sp. TaxID=1932789 RepID=UPI002E094F8A|nr:DUF4446 family protein [Jatrophihabitans sp.]
MSSYVAVFALVLAYVALVAAYVALRTLAKLRRATNLLARGNRGTQGKQSLVELTQRAAERADLMAEQIAELRAEVAAASAPPKSAPAVEAPGGLRNIALVRYDAFSEMSGRMSFSLALLDEKGDGVTISAIAGSGDTRVYAKGVASGKGEHDLSPEEQQAVSAALARRRGLRKSA